MRAWLKWMGAVACLSVAACESKSGSSGNDADGDGVPAAEDCDDTDPTLGAREDDGDCDGVPWADDCDDASPASAVRADDGDCDGIPTSADCDDTNNEVPTFDQDCDGTETELDSDDSDASVPAADTDCDGVATADDCDDANALLGDRASDADCDGATTAIDCDMPTRAWATSPKMPTEMGSAPQKTAPTATPPCPVSYPRGRRSSRSSTRACGVVPPVRSGLAEQCDCGR